MNLAARLRPSSLDDYVGQEELVGEKGIIRRMIASGTLSSMIFWGPPGTGKTTLAYIIAKTFQSDFHMLSAVSTGKEDLRGVIKAAEENQKKHIPTILFLDEIHRWNKAQQDSLLPFVENGLIILIGATTENPSFEVISALLSRSKIFVLKPLNEENLNTLITRALTDEENGMGKYKKKLDADARKLLLSLCAGDARVLLNALEMAIVTYKEKTISKEIITDIFQTKSAGLYDKKADEHYNTISAFIKSMRGSDEAAAMYYLQRMLENGEDPKFIARRMIIFAAEDIGSADRGALIQANACFEAVQKIGMPESQLILGYGVMYLANAKKSRSVPNALETAKNLVYQYPNAPIPLHLRNAPTTLMKNLGYAKDYTWSEEYVGPKTEEGFLPEIIQKKKK